MKKIADLIKENSMFHPAVNACVAILFAFLLYKIEYVWHGATFLFRLIAPMIIGVIIMHVMLPIAEKVESFLTNKGKKARFVNAVSVVVSSLPLFLLICLFAFVVIPSMITNATTVVTKLSTITSLSSSV